MNLEIIHNTKTTLMKKTVYTLMIVFILLSFFSCLKENHSVRLRNNYSEQINGVTVGNAALGNIPAGSTSEYKAIHTGNFSISGVTVSGKPLNGSGTISGKGTHKWTITLNAYGLTIVEDK